METRSLVRHASPISLMLEYVMLMQTNGAQLLQGNELASMRLGQYRRGPFVKV